MNTNTGKAVKEEIDWDFLKSLEWQPQIMTNTNVRMQGRFIAIHENLTYRLSIDTFINAEKKK